MIEDEAWLLIVLGYLLHCVLSTSRQDSVEWSCHKRRLVQCVPTEQKQLPLMW